MDGDLISEDRIDWKQYEPELMELCQVKAEEYRLLGYEDITATEVWNCVRNTNKGHTALHQMVASIISLQIGHFMNFATMNAYKGLLDTDSV